MIITGTITQVFPPDYTDPKWHNQYQNIVVDTENGEMTGRIGCKKPYTEQDIGSQGQWECTQGTNEQGTYNKFKKFSPQYGSQSTSQRSPQAPSRSPESPKPDWDAIAEGKVRTLLVGAAIESGQIKIKGVTDLTYWVGYCMTGRAPLPPSKIPDPHPDITEPRLDEGDGTASY